jgi:hypothetical protein
MVQLASMQADVVCTSRVLEHWHVVFVKVHPTAGMVCAKQLNYAELMTSLVVEVG